MLKPRVIIAVIIKFLLNHRSFGNICFLFCKKKPRDNWVWKKNQSYWKSTLNWPFSYYFYDVYVFGLLKSYHRLSLKLDLEQNYGSLVTECVQ